jgi:septal ring factor EnvC (AmiA/AmiB activator)
MEAELASVREARARAQPSVPEDEFAELERACREQEEGIGRLRSELSERSTAAEALARQLADAEDELDLLHGQQTVRNAVGLEQLAAEVTPFPLIRVPE